MGRWLVADIGGTNARFAHCPVGGGQLADHVTLQTSSASTVVALVEAYLDRVGGVCPAAACIACAGPIMEDRCVLTNSSIDFSIRATKNALGLQTLLVVNDFATVARAVPQIPSADLVLIGDAAPRPDRPSIAIGPGTGLGVATIVRLGSDRWTVLPGEGGHVALSALEDAELEVVRQLRHQFGFASAYPPLLSLRRAQS
jgi:glucokinase